MAAKPIPRTSVAGKVRLEPFHQDCAGLVAGWVRDAREAYFVAPRTAPPLTAEKVRAWRRPGCEPLLLVAEGSGEAVGYGELNMLSGVPGVFWLGHLLIAPQRRGCGLGRELTRRLLERAFTLRGARRVTLVVFPENTRAIACYRAAGMHPDGYETHYFPVYRTRARLLRLAAMRAQFNQRS